MSFISSKNEKKSQIIKKILHNKHHHHYVNKNHGIHFFKISNSLALEY
jgi:hypothetical protein